MQVPDSFYFNRPSTPEPKKDVGERRHLGDDSFRQVLANERRKAKPTDDQKQKKGDWEGAAVTEEVADQEDEEFSIFGRTRKKPNLPVRERPSGGGKSKAPFFDQQAKKAEAMPQPDVEEPIAEEEAILPEDIALQEEPLPDPVFQETPPMTPVVEEGAQELAKPLAEPKQKAMLQGREQPDARQTIVQKQQLPDAIHQQQLDEVRSDASFIFVDKKDKKDELNKTLFEYGSKSKPAAGGQTARVVPTADGGEAEVLETPTQEIVQGKAAVKEQLEEHHTDIALPGSKVGEEKFQKTLEKAQPELRHAVGMTEPKKGEPKIPGKPQEVDREGEAAASEGAGEQKAAQKPQKKDAPAEFQGMAIVHEGAVPKDRGEVSLTLGKPIEKPPLAPKLQEIVDQIIKEIYTINNDGKTETTIVLRNPPLFSGVQVTIQTFQHAKNELNITFSNLTGPGKRVLDENLGSLKAALENNERNFIVHQLVTTTVDEVPHYIAEAQQQKDREGGQQQGQQQEKEQGEEDKEEEKK